MAIEGERVGSGTAWARSVLSCRATSVSRWLLKALAETARRASYGSEEIGQEGMNRGGTKRHLNQSIPLLLCPMFVLLQEVLAASAALLPKSSSRQGSEWLRVRGRRS
jgi:hypothetical protein